ncbi:cupin domain-containing protein [Streptomyces sp. NPDC014894]|uniref:cupin domain-containing protein n=1 Tax=Streptomyces sp. NPDC014894 TaxID=3364931 RepID=UPI0036F76BA1
MDLRPHPEGGWYRETWRTGPHTRLRPPGYSGLRTAASGIYYCLEPGEESRWHRVLSDELWLWHRGGPLTLRLAGDGPAPDPGRETTVTLGPEIEAGHHPQYLVPSGHWQAARPRSGEEVLVSCVVAPGFAYEDFTLAQEPTGRGTPADTAE